MIQKTLQKLSPDWMDLQEIIVYGFGKVAQRNIDKLIQDFKVKFIVDNKFCYSPQIGEQLYKSIPMKNFQAVKEIVQTGKYKVVVCTSSLAYDSIRKTLQAVGLKEYKDYCRLSDFMTEWYWRYKKQVVLSQMSVSITSRCTLNCRHCNVFMPYYNQHYDRTVDEVINDLDLMFKRVDYLTSYFIFGGEPLLNKDLAEILRKIYAKYHEKIGYIQIITNGTVLPNDDLLTVCRECNVKIRLSDYTRQVPYEKRLQEVKRKLSAAGVEWSMGVYDTWLSLQFPEVKKTICKSAAEARKHMLTCSQGCHMLGDGKLYYCGALHSVDKSGMYALQDGDYVDLTNFTDDLEIDKLRILKYCLGDLEKREYISFCNVCYGAGPDNPYEVVAGVQMERN